MKNSTQRYLMMILASATLFTQVACNETEDQKGPTNDMVGLWQNTDVQTDYALKINSSDVREGACAGFTVVNAKKYPDAINYDKLKKAETKEAREAREKTEAEETAEAKDARLAEEARQTLMSLQTVETIDLDIRKIDASGDVFALDPIVRDSPPDFQLFGRIDSNGLMTVNELGLKRLDSKVSSNKFKNSGAMVVSILPSRNLHFQGHIATTETNNEFLKTHFPTFTFETSRVSDQDLEFLVNNALECLKK